MRAWRVARGSALLAGGFYLLLGMIPVVLGLAGPALVPGLDDAEQLLPVLASRHLPGLLYVLFAGGLVSAILSTVDTTLLTAGGLLTHNLAVPILQLTDERTRLRVSRGGVMLCGVIAWAIASTAEGVFALVEEASSFGTAGALVTVCVGLFTRIGGPWAAGSTLLGALAVYLGATFGGLETPFLASLGSALVLYLLISAAERLSHAPSSVSADAAKPYRVERGHTRGGSVTTRTNPERLPMASGRRQRRRAISCSCASFGGGDRSDRARGPAAHTGATVQRADTSRQAAIVFMSWAGIGAGQPASRHTRTIASFVSKYTCQ